MMERIAALLAAVLLLLTAAGCHVVEDIIEESLEPWDAGVPVGEEKPGNILAPLKARARADRYVGENIVLVDSEACYVEVAGVVNDSLWGVGLELVCGNRTDEPLMFAWDGVTVNGWMADPSWAHITDPGQTDTTTAYFAWDILEACGIETLDQIAFDMNIYSADDWEAEDLVEERFCIYPTGMAAEEVTVPAYVPGEGDATVMDDPACLCIVRETVHDPEWGDYLLCYVENRTDRPITVWGKDGAVDGREADTLWIDTLPAGARGFVEGSFEGSDLVGAERIEFTLEVLDEEEFETLAEVRCAYLP